MSATDEWIDTMIRAFPEPMPPRGANCYEVDAYLSRWADWVRTADPEGYKQHADHLLRVGVEEAVQELLDEKVLAGELIAERGPDGKTLYRKVGA